MKIRGEEEGEGGEGERGRGRGEIVTEIKIKGTCTTSILHSLKSFSLVREEVTIQKTITITITITTTTTTKIKIIIVIL